MKEDATPNDLTYVVYIAPGLSVLAWDILGLGIPIAGNVAYTVRGMPPVGSYGPVLALTGRTSEEATRQ